LRYSVEVRSPADTSEQLRGEFMLLALGRVIECTVQRGGTVVIPAFAVGRAQSLIHHLWLLRQAGRLANVPLYLDSPMAGSATQLLHEHAGEHKLTARDYEAACAAVTYVKEVEESKALSANRFPKVIISASGMATGGRVLHHIAAFAGSVTMSACAERRPG
jgi:metallo-beta-lactamase family protein